MTFYHLKKTACPKGFRFLRYLRRTVQKIAKNRKKTYFFKFLSQIVQKTEPKILNFFYEFVVLMTPYHVKKIVYTGRFRIMRYLRRTLPKIARNHKNLKFFMIDGEFFKKQLK